MQLNREFAVLRILAKTPNVLDWKTFGYIGVIRVDNPKNVGLINCVVCNDAWMRAYAIRLSNGFNVSKSLSSGICAGCQSKLSTLGSWQDTDVIRRYMAEVISRRLIKQRMMMQCAVLTIKCPDIWEVLCGWLWRLLKYRDI